VQKLVDGVGRVVREYMIVDAAGMDRNEVVVVVGVVVDRIAEVEVGKVEFVDTMGYTLDYLVLALEMVRAVVLVVHTPAAPDFGSDIDLPLVKVQGDSADCSPAEVDNQVESVEVVMVFDLQDS
jgi:hypothetical protein